MSSPTMSGFAAWYIEHLLGAFVITLIGYEIWCWGVRHGRRLESTEQHGATPRIEVLEIRNRPSLFDQDVD